MAEDTQKPGGPVWLQRYLEHTSRMESPTIFHQWVAIGAVGHVLGRRVFLSRNGSYGTFPGQIMVCLVGDSSITRKTTAINVATQLLRKVGRLVPESINILPDRASPQQMIQRLQPQDSEGNTLEDRDAVGLILAGELGSYFSSEGFMETLATHVTRMNDAPVGAWNKKKRRFEPEFYEMDFISHGQKTQLRNPCVGMLAGTTPTGLAKELPEQALIGGFLARTILVYASESDREPNSLLDPDPPVQVFDDLVKDLVWMAKLRGMVRITDEARQLYDNWYTAYQQSYTTVRMRQLTRGLHMITGYRGRKQDHLLRVAMVLAAMSRSSKVENGVERLWIFPNHLKAALRLLDQLEPGFERCFEFFGGGDRVGLEGKLTRMLSKPRAMKRWYQRDYLVRRMHYYNFRAPAVDDALRQLLAAQEIMKRGEGRGAEFKIRPMEKRLRATREAEGAFMEEPPEGYGEGDEAFPQPKRKSRWDRVVENTKDINLDGGYYEW